MGAYTEVEGLLHKTLCAVHEWVGCKLLKLYYVVESPKVNNAKLYKYSNAILWY